MLPVIKVSTSVGLLVGLRRPRVGAADVRSVGRASMPLRSASMGSRVTIRPLPCPPLRFGANAALCLVSCFMPAIEADNLV